MRLAKMVKNGVKLRFFWILWARKAKFRYSAPISGDLEAISFATIPNLSGWNVVFMLNFWGPTSGRSNTVKIGL